MVPKPNIPLIAVKKEAAESRVPAANPASAKKKILVVDDDRQIRLALQKLLRGEGYDVALAADGWEGIEKFERDPMDLVLLDVGLPDISGWDVFGTITTINPFVPVMIITG